MENTIDRSGAQVTPQAREQVERELLALSPSELRPICINIEVAIGATWQILLRLAAVREELVAHLPCADWSLLDRLLVYAITLEEAEQRLRTLPAANERVHISATAARGVRNRLLEQANALVALGILDVARLRQLRRDQTLAGVAFDLYLLRTVVDDGWRQFGSRPVAVARDLALAKGLEERLIATLKVKELLPQAHHDASQRRLRAYTLFISAYEELGTAVTYARYREGDAKRLMPSLYPEARIARRRAS